MWIARLDEAHVATGHGSHQDGTLGKVDVLLREGKTLHKLASRLKTVCLHIPFGKYTLLIVLEAMRQKHGFRTEERIEPRELLEEQWIVHDEVILHVAVVVVFAASLLEYILTGESQKLRIDIGKIPSLVHTLRQAKPIEHMTLARRR